MGLWYTKDSGFELTGFSDADYAGCKDTFKSTSDETHLLDKKLVSRSSKKQDCTALSTAKAEYVSLSACCAQFIWMRTLLMDYGFHFNKIPIYCDSKLTIAISCNPIQHSRTKHIAFRYHFIKEHVKKGTIELYFVKTDYQLADLFTKALLVDRFIYLVRRLGMRSLSSQELERLAKSRFPDVNHDESFVFRFGDAYGVIIFGRGNLARFGCAVGDSNSPEYSSATVSLYLPEYAFSSGKSRGITLSCNSHWDNLVSLQHAYHTCKSTSYGGGNSMLKEDVDSSIKSKVGIVFSKVDGSIEFHDVCFAYPSRLTMVFEGAVVGPSGSRKRWFSASITHFRLPDDSGFVALHVAARKKIAKHTSQVKFATCTLQDDALTWWNSHVKTTTPEVAHAMTWAALKKMMTDKYCPRGEIKKIETKCENLNV
ncbi:copia protein [Tanacetum coccineum]